MNKLQLKLLILLLVVLIMCTQSSVKYPPVVCHNPSVLTHHKHTKYIVTGHGASKGGLGNTLVHFPNVFIFAAVTGRDILIGENSALTEMCTVLVCGYTKVSTILKSLNDNDAQKFLNGRNIKVYDMGEYFRGADNNFNDNVIFCEGFLPHLTGWYNYIENNTLPVQQCLSKITGCVHGSDVACIIRYALQSLLKGPFANSFTELEKERIKGVPNHIMHGLLTLPFNYAPRFDVAIHMRIQFNAFEDGLSASSPQYQKEVNDWLNSTLSHELFGHLESQLLFQLNQSLDSNYIIQETENNEKRDLIKNPYLIFIAADNQIVKEAFIKYIQSDKSPINKIKNKYLMYTITKEIVHIKNIENVKTLTAGEGILDLVFDWYGLALSNTILNYRTGSGLLSTFVHSAAWMPGTIDKTNHTAPIGEGIGCKAYIFDMKKQKWGMFWIY